MECGCSRRTSSGVLRPFAATLGVPQQIEAKQHDTTATKSTYRTNSETVNDAASYPG